RGQRGAALPGSVVAHRPSPARSRLAHMPGHCDNIRLIPRGWRRTQAMATAREYAKTATAALHEVLNIPADALAGAAEIIEQAIRDATRERDAKARQQLRTAQAAAAQRVAQLMRSCPAVIYSFKASGDFAPTFVS